MTNFTSKENLDIREDLYISIIKEELEKGFSQFIEAVSQDKDIDAKLYTLKRHLIKTLQYVSLRKENRYYNKRILDFILEKIQKNGIENTNIKENPEGYLALELKNTFEIYINSKKQIPKIKKGILSRLLDLVNM